MPTPYSPWSKQSSVPRIRPPDISRPFAGSVTPSEALQDHPMNQNRYMTLNDSVIGHEEAIAQERSPEVSSFPTKHYTTGVMVPNTRIRPSPEALRPPAQQPGMTGLWGNPDPSRLPTGSPTWPQLNRPVDTVSSN